MALQSALFRGDAKLEAAAVSDPSHIKQGARGPHVEKIQAALNHLDDAGLDVDGDFGRRTADAVLAFKQARNIVNRSYQSTADNIVGRMTIAVLDQELQKNPPGPLHITVRGNKPRLHQGTDKRRLVSERARSFGVGAPRVGGPDPIVVQKFTRWSPGVLGTVRVAQTGRNSVAVCTNERDASQEPAKRLSTKIAFLSNPDNPRVSDTAGASEDGGSVSLKNEPHVMRLETFRPGDATITVSRPDAIRMLIVEVRQDRKGPVDRPPLTKLTAGSKFFSATEKEGGEFDPRGVFHGRPVQVKMGGRLINLGGELETPQFEDYQVDLGHSGGHDGFRPWTDDPDASTFIPSGSASHITMRGTPLLEPFIKVIRRIAQPKCLFTFSSSEMFLNTIRTQIPGRELELTIREPKGDSKDRSIDIAWEIT